VPGPRRGLSREKIVRATLSLVDREGVEGLTMRALGRELGADPMAVYHYVPSKAALFDAVADAVWASVELPAPTGSPRDDLAALARSIRRSLLRHPRALPVVATRQSLGPPTLHLLEAAVGALVRGGVEPAAALRLAAAASAFLVGAALAEAGPPPLGAAEVPQEAFLERVAAGGHPNLVAALAPGAPLHDEVFEAGLVALLAGLPPA
jgi:TetR/AcrR family transcriptional regulator, tetracycline repressor protein